jgi:hypothetical protein
MTFRETPGWRWAEARPSRIASQTANKRSSVKSQKSFFGRVHEKFFDWKVNFEIFNRIFPHTQGEKDFGYPFNSRQEMARQTQTFEVEMLMREIAEMLQTVPQGYAQCFHHVMDRDLSERLRIYKEMLRRRVTPKWLDPRCIATRA